MFEKLVKYDVVAHASIAFVAFDEKDVFKL
jgi:hypothetical protein